MHCGPVIGMHYKHFNALLQRTRQAMSNVGIPLEEQVAICQLVAVVLHLGNMRFVAAGDPDSSQVDPAVMQHSQVAAELLGVNAAGLVKALTTRTRQTVDGEFACCW